MLKAIAAWRQKRRHRQEQQSECVFDEQLLSVLGLSLEDVKAARNSRTDLSIEGPVFP